MKTILYDSHKALGAHFFSFHGFEMPLFYTSVLEEHRQVRDKAGLFDVTHMGVIEVKGEEALKFLDYLSVTPLLDKPEKTATYTLFANEKGGTVDDLLIFKLSENHFFLIVNASCRDKDLEHLLLYKKAFKVTVIPLFQEIGTLALQGPLSRDELSKLFPSILELEPFQFTIENYEKKPILLSRTGYTGALGYEIVAPFSLIPVLWEQILTLDPKIKPIGLGARDTLRLEMGYALYGHELSETIAPNESVSSWTVHLDKHDFLGKEALVDLSESLNKRYEQGILFEEGRISREGTSLYFDNNEVGVVTSGNFSPTLNCPIAIGLFTQKFPIGTLCKAKVKDKEITGKIVRLPFVKSSIKGGSF